MTTLAFVFPGQGSQSVAMLEGWGAHPIVKQTLQEAADTLQEDIGSLIKQGPKEALNLTVNTQPAMLIGGIVAYRIWMAEVGLQPAMVAGHSLGEYTALVAAGVLSFSDAISLVRYRAQVMQEAVPVGAGGMAAILGLDASVVTQICQNIAQAGDTVEAVNFNDPIQTVIAGTQSGIEKACEALKAAGAKRALPLTVSAPFHSSLMQPAAERLKEKLTHTAFAVPQIALINNIDVQIERDPIQIRDALYRQAFGPVRWVETIQAVAQQGCDLVVECGPGKVLSGMVKRIQPALKTAAFGDVASLEQVRQLL